MNNQETERLEDYLDGTLSVVERQKLEERLAKEADLQAALQWHQDLRQVATAAEELRLIKMLKNTSSKPANIFRLSYTMLAIAAAILFLIIVGIWWLNRPSSNDLYAQYFQPYPNVSVSLERNEPVDDLTIRAFQSYEKANYPLAAAQLDSLLRVQPNTDYRFYLAMAQLANENYLPAIQHLETVQQATNTDFQNYANWYLALAYWKTGDIAKAKVLFEKIVGNENHAFYQKAKEVLGEHDFR